MPAEDTAAPGRSRPGPPLPCKGEGVIAGGTPAYLRGTSSPLEDAVRRPEGRLRRASSAQVPHPVSRPGARAQSLHCASSFPKQTLCWFALGALELPGREKLLIQKAGYARQLLALQELQGRAAAGGDMGHLVGIAQLGHSRRAVAAADDGDGVGLGQGLYTYIYSAKAGNSNTPMGPFQITVPAPFTASV